MVLPARLGDMTREYYRQLSIEYSSHLDPDYEE